ncbi:Ig-like domain-containing protein [Marinilabiliaceae bacterium ANBcel2]|nr:Ig-like domain-containing protein [Marinilabiliaceae bacterium ANBcel2]
MHIIKRYISFGETTVYLVTFCLLLIYGCASTGQPSGGPRDEDPPVLLSSVPEEGALGFTEDVIVLKFDELVELDNIFQKLMVSPPVNEQPTVTARADEVHIEFNEELQSNTTYTIDFADAIRDVNEGNVLHDFRFSFSTGEEIDSLSVSGFLFDARTLEPVEGALVMVHTNLADSAFQTLVPVRVTKTNPQGEFRIQNMAEGDYRLYALEDQNRNFIYDMPEERIAFHPELISPYIGTREVIDSISSDSVRIYQEEAYLPDSINLYMYSEEGYEQYVKELERTRRRRIDIEFNAPLEEKPLIELIDNDRDDWFVLERSLNYDSLTLWLTDTTLIGKDSLLMSLEYPYLDSLEEVSYRRDTINAYYFETRESRLAQEKEDEEEFPPFNFSGPGSSLHFTSELVLQFPTPVKELDSTKISLYEVVNDSVKHDVPFKLLKDSLTSRNYRVDFEREAGTSYSIEADSAAFKGLYREISRSYRRAFEIPSLDSYGTFYVRIDNPEEKWLIELLNSSEEVVRSMPVPENGRVAFRYLQPANYYLRIVDDQNENGRWDPGNFMKGVEPEKVIYFPDRLNIRSNWERVIDWNPAEFDVHDFVERNRR